MSRNIMIVLSIFGLSILSANAQNAQVKKNTVMDFEAEVIDGQKKAPELFLQLDSEKADLNTILYDRKNFNDFTPINTQLRPLFSDMKKAVPPGGQK